MAVTATAGRVPAPSTDLTPDEQRRLAAAVQQMSPATRKKLSNKLRHMSPRERKQFDAGIKSRLAQGGRGPQPAAPGGAVVRRP